MTITFMSVGEAVVRSLSEMGVLQKQVDNQQENFNVQVGHKPGIVSSLSGKSKVKTWISTAIEVSQWTLGQ